MGEFDNQFRLAFALIGGAILIAGIVIGAIIVWIF